MKKRSLSVLSHILRSSRPVSWINTAYPFAAAYFFMTGQVDATLIIGTVFFLIPYNLVMYGINDVFDYESDIRNPRKGGIEGAVLAKSMHRPVLVASAISALPFLIALILLGNPQANLVLVLVVFFVLAYSLPVLRFKERPFLDSITSSAHFVGPAVYAFSLTAFTAASIPILAAFFLWGMASHAFGAVQDIRSDREGGLRSIATVIGARWTVRFAFALYIIASLIIAFIGTLEAIVVALSLLCYALNVAPYLRLADKKCEEANKAWRRFIYINLFAGFVITVALIYVLL